MRIYCLLVAAGLLLVGTTSNAQSLNEENLPFDCRGAVLSTVTDASGARSAVASVQLNIDLPNGDTLVAPTFLTLGKDAQNPVSTSSDRIRLRRCRGLGNMSATRIGTFSGQSLYSFTLVLTQVRIQLADGTRIGDPDLVGVSTTMGGTPEGFTAPPVVGVSTSMGGTPDGFTAPPVVGVSTTMSGNPEG